MERVRLINDNVIEVNLDAPPKPPFMPTEAFDNPGGGWVRVERRKDGLYVDGNKTILHVDEAQRTSTGYMGMKLFSVLRKSTFEHPNIMDALMEYPQMIPDECLPRKNNTVYTFFAGVKFIRREDGLVFVRCMFQKDGVWQTGQLWLECNFNERCLFAMRKLGERKEVKIEDIVHMVPFRPNG